jgi:hypothetical protein
MKIIDLDPENLAAIQRMATDTPILGFINIFFVAILENRLTSFRIAYDQRVNGRLSSGCWSWLQGRCGWG